MSQATAAVPPTSLPRLLLLSAAAGIVAAVAAVAFVVVVHQLEHAVWTSVPTSLGYADPPWWWVAGALALGGLLVAGAIRLPGHGGHTPVDGLSMQVSPSAIASIVLAALASLVLGAVVGPEAPLIAIGSVIGAVAARRSGAPIVAALAMGGAAAAVGTIFGNPLITSILILEGALLSGVAKEQAARLAPAVLVALGAGYLVQVGVGDWGGFGSSVLAVPGLPAYGSVQVVDLLVGLVAAIATGVVVVAIRWAAQVVQPRATGRPVAFLVGGGLVVAACALAARALTGEPVDVVLTSGQAAIGEVLTWTAVPTLLVVLVAKAVAYGASIGVGFRGGAVFPAVFLAAVIATVSTQAVPSASISAIVATTIAAATAATLRLPFTSALLALLLCAAAGPSVTTGAILGAIVGLVVRVATDRRLDDDRAPHQGATPDPQQQSA